VIIWILINNKNQDNNDTDNHNSYNKMIMGMVTAMHYQKLKWVKKKYLLNIFNILT